MSRQYLIAAGTKAIRVCPTDSRMLNRREEFTTTRAVLYTDLETEEISWPADPPAGGYHYYRFNLPDAARPYILLEVDAKHVKIFEDGKEIIG